TALLFFDFVLTFTTEVERVWRSKVTGATLVYYLLRYSALIERLCECAETFVLDMNDEVREPSSTAANVILVTLTWIKTLSIKKHFVRGETVLPLTAFLFKDGSSFCADLL
ncbi:hypothetical protein C8Q76DRAFT_609614, partial [Earliella scabrosa]